MSSNRPEWNRAYYEKTKERYRETRAASRRRIAAESREFLVAYKESNPCTDCGRHYPYYVMQFDHLYDKRYNVSGMRGFSLDKIKSEIAKCELVCSNCHAFRTHMGR